MVTDSGARGGQRDPERSHNAGAGADRGHGARHWAYRATKSRRKTACGSGCLREWTRAMIQDLLQAVRSPDHVLAWEIGDDRVQLTICAGTQRLSEPLLELVLEQPAFVVGATQPFSNLSSIGIRRSKVAAVLSHAQTIPLQTA